MDSIKIEEAAAEWLACLDRPETTSDVRAAFERWRDANPRHAAAYLRLNAAWQRADRLQALRPPDAAGIDPDYFREGAPDASEQFVVSVAPPRSQWRLWSLASAAMIAFLSVGIVIVQSMRVDIFATTTGGFERVRLDDGSIVELNTDTRLRVDLSRTTRRIELLQGEATFTVAHDMQRPFVVSVDGTSVRAVGTKFNVRRRSQSIDVLVTEGKVMVGAGPAMQSVSPVMTEEIPIIAAGQSVRIATGSLKLEKISQADAERALAWHSGMLEFDAITLAEVVIEFNRYNLRQLLVTDTSLAQMRIGGQFKATNLDGFVNVLEENFGVQARHEDNQIVLLKRTASQREPAAFAR